MGDIRRRKSSGREPVGMTSGANLDVDPQTQSVICQIQGAIRELQAQIEAIQRAIQQVQAPETEAPKKPQIGATMPETTQEAEQFPWYPVATEADLPPGNSPALGYTADYKRYWIRVDGEWQQIVRYKRGSTFPAKQRAMLFYNTGDTSHWLSDDVYANWHCIDNFTSLGG